MTLEAAKEMDKCCVLNWLNEVYFTPSRAFNEYTDDELKMFAHDALVLLKEQEPKLLTFDEVKKHFLVPKELLGNIEEYIDYANDIEPLYMECRVEDAFVCHWRTHDNISMNIDDWKNEYGKTWRCWTQKPTPEQMNGVKWDDCRTD